MATVEGAREAASGKKAGCTVGSSGLHPTSCSSPEPRLSWAQERCQGRLQTVKNPPAMRKTRVQFSGREDPLEEGTWQPTTIFLPGESHGWGAWQAKVHGIAKSWTQLVQLSTHTHKISIKTSNSYIPRWKIIIISFHHCSKISIAWILC